MTLFEPIRADRAAVRFTAEDIAAMSVEEYAQIRHALRSNALDAVIPDRRGGVNVDRDKGLTFEDKSWLCRMCTSVGLPPFAWRTP